MSLLSHLHPSLKLAASRPRSTEEEIQTLVDFSPIPVPTEYLELIREGSDMEIGVNLGTKRHCFIRIYGAANAVDLNEACEVQADLQNVLGIGDNEGGGMLVLAPEASPPGIYRIPMACLHHMSEATYIAANLTEILVDGKNLDLIF